MIERLLVRKLGLVDYLATWEKMETFTRSRDANSGDELWLLQHPPVFTQGVAGKAEHLLRSGNIPVVQSNRGGQVTYHGPGQIVAYVLLDIRRKALGVRQLVSLLEDSIIELLASWQIKAYAKPKAPGVYVDDAKVAALGLRISKGRSYHGLSLNVAMDLKPYSDINPCGYQGLRVTQLKDLGINATPESIENQLSALLAAKLRYTSTYFSDSRD